MYLGLLGLNYIIFFALLFYPFMFILFFLISSKEDYLKESFRKEYIEFFTILVITFLIFLAGVFIINKTYEIKLELPFEEYNFEIFFSPGDNIILNNLYNNYNFETGKGDIFFRITNINYFLPIEYFFIESPTKLNITGVRLYTDNGFFYEGKDFRKSINGSYIHFDSFNSSLDGVYVNITLDGDLIPNGIFNFFVNAKKSNSNGRESILFNLGRYECKSICFGEMKNSAPEINNNILIIKYPQDYYGENGEKFRPLQQKVTLNTNYSPAITSKQNLTNIYISLTIAGLLFFGEIIRKYIRLLV
ncbi:MAG: hypothetical protein V1815_01690 [Candidatus Woesearchaeota archaeon]